MPIYEFECKKCKEKFQTLCKMGESAKSVKCELCGSSNVKRLFSTFAAHVKDSDSGSSGSSGSMPGGGQMQKEPPIPGAVQISAEEAGAPPEGDIEPETNAQFERRIREREWKKKYNRDYDKDKLGG